MIFALVETQDRNNKKGHFPQTKKGPVYAFIYESEVCRFDFSPLTGSFFLVTYYVAHALIVSIVAAEALKRSCQTSLWS
jgi:hypothetical protein